MDRNHCSGQVSGLPLASNSQGWIHYGEGKGHSKWAALRGRAEAVMVQSISPRRSHV